MAFQTFTFTDGTLTPFGGSALYTWSANVFTFDRELVATAATAQINYFQINGLLNRLDFSVLGSRLSSDFETEGTITITFGGTDYVLNATAGTVGFSGYTIQGLPSGLVTALTVASSGSSAPDITVTFDDGQPIGTRDIDFVVQTVPSNANNFTVLGLASDDSDDQPILPELLVDPDEDQAVDYIRIRWHPTRADRRNLQIFFAGTSPQRFSRDAEINLQLWFQGPVGTDLATWRGADLGGMWSSSGNRYDIDLTSGFLSSNDGEALVTAIRALGDTGDAAARTVRIQLLDPFDRPAGATGVSGAATATAGLKEIDPKLAGAAGASFSSVAAASPLKRQPITKSAYASGASASGAAIAGAQERPSFLAGAPASSRHGAITAGARKIPVGPPKPLSATGASSSGAANADLKEIDPKLAGAAGASEESAIVAGLKEIDPKLAGAAGATHIQTITAGARTLDPILDPPSALVLLDRGRDFISIGWNAPLLDFGLPITYEVRVDGREWRSAGENRFFRITGLAIDLSYSIEVRGVNNEINGEPSIPVRFSTIAPPPPSAPLYPVGVSAGRTIVDLTWREPRDTGGVELLRYEVCVIDEDGTEQPFEATEDTSLSWRIRGLAAGHRYGFRVRAVNRTDVGAASELVYVVPGAVTTRPVVQLTSQRVPLIDADRQSLILRIDGRDVLLRVWAAV